MTTPEQPVPESARKWRDMTLWEKVKFVGKAFVFFVTGGFAYPNLFSDD